MAKPKAFQIFIDTRGMVDLLSDEEAGQLFKALFAHADGDEDEPELDKIVAVAAYPMMQQIDRDREKYEDICEKRANVGRIGGEAKASKSNQNVAKASNCQNDVAKGSKSCQYKNKDEDKKEYKEKSIKEKYGVFENVLLTKEEHSKLKEQFSDYQERIDRLSEYIASTGKSYKSHYATILSWARKDKKEKPPDKKRGSMFSTNGSSFDLAAYERKDLFDG